MQDFSSQIEDSTTKVFDKIELWIDLIFLNFPNVVLAILIFVVGYFLSGLVKKLVTRFASRFTKNVTVLNLISNITTVFFYSLMLFLILAVFDLGSTINKILATAGVLGLAVGLALQDPLVNLFSGVMMSIRDLYKIGDIVETNGYTGVIEDISLRSTTLAIFSGQEVTIPNKDVIQNPLTNYSVNGLRRVELPIGVSYGEDLELVQKIAINAVKNIDAVIQNKPIEVFYTSYGDSSINFDLRFWHIFKAQSDYMHIRSQAIIEIKKAFDANDISIPFPIRTLDFGIKGGVSLTEEMNIKSEN